MRKYIADRSRRVAASCWDLLPSPSGVPGHTQLPVKLPIPIHSNPSILHIYNIYIYMIYVSVYMIYTIYIYNIIYIYIIYIYIYIPIPPTSPIQWCQPYVNHRHPPWFRGWLPRCTGQTLGLSRCESKVDDGLRGTEATRAMQWCFFGDLTSNFQPTILGF